MDKMAAEDGSSSGSDKEAIRAIQSGAIGNQLGPYAVS